MKHLCLQTLLNVYYLTITIIPTIMVTFVIIHSYKFKGYTFFVDAHHKNLLMKKALFPYPYITSKY